MRVALWLILFGPVGAVLLAGPLLAMRGGEEIGTDLPRGTDEAIAAGLATCAGILVFALAVVAKVLARWDARLPESPLMLVYVALPCILLAVVTLAAGMCAWQSRPAAAIVSSSGPHGAPESVGEAPPSHPTEP